MKRILLTLIFTAVAFAAPPDIGSPQYELCKALEKMSFRYRDLGLVKKLVKKGADPIGECPGGFYPMYIAAERGVAPVVKYFIEELKIPVDAKQLRYSKSTGQYSGYTPLEAAIRTCNTGLAMYLLKKGANPHIVNLRDPLEEVIGEIYPEYKKALIEAAAYEMKDRVRFLVLKLYDCLMTVGLVIDYGADPNRRLSGNKTLLHVAAARGLPEVYEFLVKYGAREDVVDDFFYTPRDLKKKNIGDDPRSHPYYLDISLVYELLDEWRSERKRK
ncbi:MAG TPA: ankyrin repeat domain-containing protein [Aquifex aeolicus]|uniref:Ankyrin repeat domain-containing protein n=1 Tax=Aquifex aeolicus TaxID=63363 RepID=A0A7C5Q2S2_AQUAO|nr:ankyrin repeat domain-containing protein [Aquifex aeolicus]